MNYHHSSQWTQFFNHLNRNWEVAWTWICYCLLFFSEYISKHYTFHVFNSIKKKKTSILARRYIMPAIENSRHKITLRRYFYFISMCRVNKKCIKNTKWTTWVQSVRNVSHIEAEIKRHISEITLFCCRLWTKALSERYFPSSFTYSLFIQRNERLPL